jgi:hypothetical protein
MFDYSIEFTLLALFLAAVTIYGTKGKRITQTDVLYGLLLAAFYYVLLCVIDQYQTAKEGFKLLTEGYSSKTPPDYDDADYGDDENTNSSDHGTGIPTPPVGSPAPASLTDAHDTSSGDHHHAPSDHHHDSKPSKSQHMNHDKRPSTNKHHMDEPITATAGVDAPINITINLDDDVTKEYKRVPHRHHDDPQFDDGLAADRLARLERRVEELVTRDLDNQYQEVVERSPEFSREPQIIYKYKEKDCPVCPLVAEKPWSEWEDAGHQRRDGDRFRSCLDKGERESWDAGMVGSRGGNNPLPVLP